MNRFKRFLSLFLVLATVAGLLPQISLGVFATGSEPEPVTFSETTEPQTSEKLAEGESITRAEWISNLVASFGMMVEEDNYPDNYYSDITSDDDFYRDIMVAVEFGVINLAAGMPFRPNDPATREFAAQTLNFALGFQLDENAAYTFSESASVTYPDDIQIAINRGWFTLVNGAFLPNQAITEAERNAMMADVESVLAGDEIDENYESNATVSAGVVEVPMGTVVSIPAEGVVEITDCPVEIKAGDLFVVYYGDLPLAYKALEVEHDGNVTLISCTDEGAEDAIASIDYEGTIEADLENFEGTGATTFSIGNQTVYMGRTTYGIDYDQNKKVLTATKTASLGDGITATISAKISNLKFDLIAKKLKGQYSCVMSGDTTLTTNVSVDLMEALGEAKTVEMGRIYIGGVGYVKLSVEFSLSGEITLVWTGEMKAGFSYNRSEGLRVIGNYKKKSFTFMAEVTLRSGLRLDAGVDVLVFDANVWAKIGAQLDVKSTSYNPGPPEHCLDMDGFMYASVGVDGSIIKIIDFHKSYDIYTRSNSPIRAHFHYEDGVAVLECTKGKASEGNDATSSDYYTDPSSKNFTPGTSNGSSSYTGSSGETVVIYKYTLDSNNNATITGYSGGASALSIPSTIDGYTVTAIGSKAFQSNTSLYAVKLPNTVTSVGSYAFDGCTNLSVVTLSKNVTTLGEYAFRNCDALAEIEIPKKLTSGGRLYSTPTSTYAHGAFAYCSGLKTVNFEEGTTKIASYLFESCDGLEKIVIPDTVTGIGQRTFENAVNLKQVVFGKAITEIGNYAFSGCEKLEAVEMQDSVTAIGAYAFVNCSGMKTLRLSRKLNAMYRQSFGNCTSLTSVEIPKSLTVGGTLMAPVGSGDSDWAEGAFYGCSNLKNVTFEQGITEIPSYLFSDCTGIEEIVIPDTVIRIGQRAFEQAKNLKKVTFGKAIQTIGKWAFYDCESLEAVELQDEVTLIGASAFADCTGLKQVRLSKKLTTMYWKAFENCTSLTEIEIPKSLNIGGEKSADTGYSYGAFYKCSGLKKVSFEEGTTQIAEYLFSKCTGIEEIVIPDTVTVIEKRAFEDTSNLKKIIFGGGLKTIQEYAFTNSGLTEIVIPDSVTSVGYGILAGCKSLKTATWTAGYPSIYSYAFDGCTALTTVNLPDNLEKILAYTFRNCDSLIEINIPDSVTAIWQQAFYDCDRLKTVNLSNNLNLIDQSCFYDCDALETITIPDTVTRIGTYLFYSCDKLKNVKLSNALAEIPNYTFAQCAELEEIVIPRSVTKIGTYAFNASPKLAKVVIPASVTSIGSKAFSYADITVVYGVAGSYAETWAANNGFQFVAQDIPATEIALNKTELNLLAGKSETLQLTIVPENSTDAVTWKSSDVKVATVTNNGIVEAVGAGTATIKVTVGDLSTSCKVNVIQPVTSISLNAVRVSMYALNTYQLTATVSPSNAFDSTVTWSSADDTIATVDENGLVTALKKGTVMITATANDGSGKSANCEFYVISDAFVVTDVEHFESPHPYANSCKDVWMYTSEGAASLAVTFDEQTMMEDGFDYLYIYDGEGQKLGSYTGAELAGKTITITGDTIKIQMVSDDSGNGWGFKVTNIVAATSDHVHEYESVVTDPTCEESGYTTHTCSCGDSYIDSYVDALGHEMGEWIITKDASCTEAGSMSRNCGYCDYSETEEIAATGHDYVNGVCTRCGASEDGTVTKLEGLNCVDGVWGYYTDGVLDTSYTNMVFYDGIFYYVENGLINWDYVGLAQHKETEVWYYVNGGGVDRSFTGLTMYNGRWFYLEAGSITWSYTGLVEFEGNWYYVQYSQLNFDYTGLVLHGDVWYYVQDSVLSWGQYTLVNHGGTWYYIQNSMLQWGYYGLVNYNGVWYYLENSQITWNFTDLVLYNDVWYYVKGSTIAWDYTGVVSYGGGMYYVENGTINWSYYGSFTQDGVTYEIANGTVVG